MIPHVLIRLALLISLILTPSLSTAAPSLDSARALRLAGQSQAALRQLDHLLTQNPQHVGYHFERGVALAELGRCGDARRAFDSAKSVSNTPAVDTEIQRALGDLCPVRSSGWERSLGARLIADNNYNNATSARSVFVGPFEFALDEDARAQERYGVDINAYAGYRWGVSTRAAIVPYIHAGLLALNDGNDSRLRLAPGVALDWNGRAWSTRVGPVARFEVDGDGLVSRAYGLDGRLLRPLGPRDGVEITASWARLEHRNTVDTGRRVRAEAAWLHRLNNGAWLRTSLAHTIAARTPAFRTERDTRVNVAYSGRINADFGLELGASLGHTSADAPHPFFGTTRSDTITTLSAGITLDSIATPFGRPIIGVSHTRARSNIVLHDYAKNAVFLGFARNF